MSYSKQNEDFILDKQSFFSQVMTNKNTTIEDIDTRSQSMGYPFLLKNKQALETEFTSMFNLLKQQKEENMDAFWLYCYYLASLLEAFHRTYSQSTKEKEYVKLKQEIKKRMNQEYEDKLESERFIIALRTNFTQGIKGLLTAPLHLSQIRDHVAYANLCRIYWLFCRLTLTQGLNMANEAKIIEKLDKILGTHTDVSKIIAVFKAPIGVINYFSVGFFLARFMIDGGLLIKHTLFPTELEKAQGTTALERFKHELYKRHCNFANDLVWATVNFLTNFNQITHISGPVANYLTSVFLVFDVCMNLYKCDLAKKEYLSKKAQYLQEMEQVNASTEYTKKQKLAQINMLDKQLQDLEINWQVKEANFYFVTAAAVILAVGFTVAVLASPAMLILAGFFIGQIGVAMYLSSGAYTTFKEKQLYLQQTDLVGHNAAIARKEYEIARNDFIFTMIKNTIMPTILIATFAICWPAAIVLTAAYIGYELYHAKSQHNDKRDVKASLFWSNHRGEEDPYEEVIVPTSVV